MRHMTPLRPRNFRLEEELLNALDVIRERDGISNTEQVRRALKAWIESKGVKVKTERKRASTRQRP
jgi:metal-responsive CopG/Arc/MetJ family transcriptional regulator